MEAWREELYHSDVRGVEPWRNELYHFGILGMKWGIRRFQNKDGSLTPAGKARKKQDAPDSDADAKKINNYEEPSVWERMSAEDRERHQKIKAEYPAMQKAFRDNAKDISQRCAQELTDDVFRWLNEADDEESIQILKDYYTRGRSKEKMESDMAKDIEATILSVADQDYTPPKISNTHIAPGRLLVVDQNDLGLDNRPLNDPGKKYYICYLDSVDGYGPEPLEVAIDSETGKVKRLTYA